MKKREEYKTTINRSVYNKVRKIILEHDGDIHCSRCGYNKGENNNDNWYRIDDGDTWTDKYPNWKLTSKNRKQWMPKGLKLKKHCYYYNQVWYSISW